MRLFKLIMVGFIFLGTEGIILACFFWLSQKIMPKVSFCYSEGNGMKHLLIVSALLILNACASTNFRPEITYRDQLKDTRDAASKADDMKWSDASDITVLSDPDSLPQGLSVDKNGTLNVDPSSGYEIVANVGTVSKGKVGGISEGHSVPYYFYDYAEDESGFRSIYCHIQTPLLWVTLSLWSIVPLNYPCMTVDSNSPNDIENRKIRLVNTLKKATKAVGATHLYFSKAVPFSYTKTSGVGTRIGNTAVFGGTSEESKFEWAQAFGVALRKK